MEVVREIEMRPVGRVQGAGDHCVVRLEDIKKDAIVEGILPHDSVRIVSAEPIGQDAVNVVFRTPTGALQEQTLFRGHEPSLSLVEVGLPWSFDADGDDFKLAAEAYRIHVAHLFDPMMAVHTSSVDPLPHQITAVYESMLPRQPLRYVLADDPGAGKTIMAGLYMRELLIRADAQRILIIAPGSLVEQWQDELYEKFDMEFEIFSRQMVELSHTGNVFDEHDLLIARLDQLSRSTELQEQLGRTRWDLVVVDEAHKMSASWYGNKMNETKRFKLGKLAGSVTRHFLLMTATPHNGKEEDFQLFLSLLDSDRFYGKFRDGVHQVDVKDVMRRMVKEELLKFDGKPLFPERRAETVSFELSDLEAALYQQVTEYVREEMNRADRLKDGKRKGTVGFALTTLQRRLASSPEAIYQSLRRRRERLIKQLNEAKVEQQGRFVWQSMQDVPDDIYESDEEMSGEDYEDFEEEIASQATASQTIHELELEIQSLEHLEQLAHEVVQSDQDSKWAGLSDLLHDEPEMIDSTGQRRKLIVFTEHRDTLNYLRHKMEDFLGRPESIVTIHGGTKREERRKIQEKFRFDHDTLILLATDAAGEGVNLQNANLLINYDLPWNPNRLEQRFGRIHRIGQTEICYMWNLVAGKTREGEVFQRLFEKLNNEREALKGRVFDILGEVFEQKSLKELLIEAIRHGDDPEVRARLEREVEGALDREHLQAVMARNALCEEVMSPERLYEVKEEMEKAQARRLHPYFIRAFFREAFSRLGGELKERESERYEISYVPGDIRERDRQISGRDRGNRKPVLKRYERVCFERELVRNRMPMAALLHTGHPLMQAVTDLTLERGRAALKQGAVLVDDQDDGDEPYMLFLVEHAVREQLLGQEQRDVSRRVQFVGVYGDGRVELKGYAPHLDLRRATEEEKHLTEYILHQPWLAGDLDSMAQKHAIALMGGPHFQEVQTRRESDVERIKAEVHTRLSSEIMYWQDRYLKFKDAIAAGKQPRMGLEVVKRNIDDMTARLEQRKRELDAMKHVVSAAPVVIGGSLVVPTGLLRKLRGDSPSVDAVNRARVERLAMDAVMAAERELGHEVKDVSAQKCGWDVTATFRNPDGSLGEERHIEVKGRAKGQTTVTVSCNEVMYGLNQGDKFLLAVCIVDGETVHGPHYIRHPFRERPDWAEVSKNLDLRLLLDIAVSAEQSL